MFSLGNFSLGALIGLVLGALLGHVLAIRRGKLQKKHEASISFRQELIPALDELQSGGNQFKIIQNSFDRHHKAALVFAAYLDGYRRYKFLKDLRKYSNWREEIYGRDVAEVLYDTDSPPYKEAKATSPIDLLNALMDHART